VPRFVPYNSQYYNQPTHHSAAPYVQVTNWAQPQYSSHQGNWQHANQHSFDNQDYPEDYPEEYPEQYPDQDDDQTYYDDQQQQQ